MYGHGTRALLPDRCVGPEAISYYKEKDIRQLIKLHKASAESDIEKVEDRGAMNFLELDDVPLAAEGEPIDPDSIVPLPFLDDNPVFPEIKPGLSESPLPSSDHCSERQHDDRAGHLVFEGEAKPQPRRRGGS